MIIKKPGSDKLVDLNVNWDYIIGDWCNLFGDDFLHGEYMSNLMAFLYLNYEATSSTSMRPMDKNHIFRPFRECGYNECKLVIMTEYPTTSVRSNGLGVGNNNLVPEHSLSRELYQFKKCIENTCWKGLNVNFDNTLESLAKQGVLLLNSSLTCSSLDNRAHTKYWDKFMTQLITDFQERSANIVFAFIGDACKYADLIDVRFHEVVEEPLSIDECIQKKEYWMSDFFLEINKSLGMFDSIPYGDTIKFV